MKTCPNYLKDFSDLWDTDPHAANLAWFKQAEFGLFMHYGLYSQLARQEWVMLNEAIPTAEYEKLFETFDPSAFDAEAITDLALDAGMRYVNITTCHHEGFCLWDSATEPFNAKQACGLVRWLRMKGGQTCQCSSRAELCVVGSHQRQFELSFTASTAQQAFEVNLGRHGIGESHDDFAYRRPELLERAIGAEHALVDDHDAVGHAFDVGEDVAGEQDGASLSRDQLDHALQELPPDRCIQTQRRIVHDQQLRVRRQRQGQGDLGPLAVR